MESPEKTQNSNDLIKKYENILESNPKDLKNLSNLGKSYALKNNFRKAEEIFNKILEADPKDFEALTNLGIIFAQSGKLEDAITKLEAAVKIKPDSVKIWNTLSETYRRIGNFRQANVCRMRAIHLSEKK